MGLKVGDSFFNREGYPGFITGRDKASSALIVEKEGENFERSRRLGYVNGLNPQEREKYDSIMSEMRKRPEAVDRVNWLHDKLDTLSQDPKQQVLTRYLEGEMAHIMNSEGISPRSYTLDETKV
ncbi:MAG: hypothetical protein NTX25_19635 [Proteobacteria bacterium]|nr:hypothetical protein [Pseudomonadota bacterium]